MLGLQLWHTMPILSKQTIQDCNLSNFFQYSDKIQSTLIETRLHPEQSSTKNITCIYNHAVNLNMML